ncbi:hypothetical protein T01_14175 [Trichinella spiralis]|uniref:Uncharacterized protein n=1 Tax=Trichinella spiralis TaxID=6334 RepID=A0A0V1AYE3_TRISP|nr:hypothetical protein T01_13483 [Trichinella spiralis]KRY29686.1 hypothetical protein T01_14175 [Trichinella spiralis]
MPNSEDIATVNYGMHETNVKFTAVNRGSVTILQNAESLVFFEKLKLITEGIDFVDVIYPKPIGYKMFKKNEQMRLNLRSCQNSVWKNEFVWNV